jgi:hypothetical protein
MIITRSHAESNALFKIWNFHGETISNVQAFQPVVKMFRDIPTHITGREGIQWVRLAYG